MPFESTTPAPAPPRPPPPGDAIAEQFALADSLAALAASEQAAVHARRVAVLKGDADTAELNLPRVGLALSGGGVRSATFALGLLRGLAQDRAPAEPDSSASTADDTDGDARTAAPARPRLAAEGLLGRLDYLSTVSGGGYTGGMFGRLVAAYGLAEAQKMLSDSGASVLEWLRRNGRYLTPAGSRDTGIAVVTYLRAWLAIHTEFMFACCLVGLVVVAPHLLQHSQQWVDPAGWERWYSPWWPLAVGLWAIASPGLIAGYWAARDAPERESDGHGGGRSDAVPNSVRQRPGARDGVFMLTAAASAWVLWRLLQPGGTVDPLRYGLNWPTAGLLALVSLASGQAIVLGWLWFTRETYALSVARLRNWLTRALRVVLLASLALAAMGALDRLSWWVLEEFLIGNQWLWGGVGVGSVVLVVLRALIQPLQQIAAETSKQAQNWLPRLLSVGSLVGVAALVTAWLTVLQWFVFAPETFSGLRDVPAVLRAGLLLLGWLVWMLLTAGNAQMANTSSLHSFYRGRLTRAYLAVGNLRRSIDKDHPHHADVTTVVEGDDTRLANYRPEATGGPIHLVNTCLNQTRDDQSGLYNADRKGTALTATWRGFEIGPEQFLGMRPSFDAGTLGRWVAVSGAAASPGAGAYTSRGLALLVYFLGVRLGHWMRAPRERVTLRWLSRLAWDWWPKPLMLTSEASATFFGVERPWWYLSDGGHFENTGVYALLKRELDFIILSDASCDADYEFGDLENLVRKARIDFGAEIDFYSQDEASRLFSMDPAMITVLSPEDMANNHSCRGVLLARIRYRERPGPDGAAFRPEGTLLVVKPNLHDALDVDLLAYAQKHESFPHESTGDQSFDEAQWESYHRLGEDFGRALSDDWLAQLPGWHSPAKHNIRISARLSGSKGEAAPRAEPLWRRGARATAIGTTLGVGFSGTLLLSMWQVQDQLQRNRSDEQTETRQLFTDVSKGLQGVDGACPQIPEHVVTQASLLFELRGSAAMRPLEQAGLDRLAGRIAEECRKDVTSAPGCLSAYQRMQSDLCTLVRKAPTEDTALNYWHPGTSPEEQARAAGRVWRAVAGYFPSFPGLGRLPVEVATAPPPAAPPVQMQVPQTEAVPQAAAAADAAAEAALNIMPLRACARPGGGSSTLYLQIYDEASRPAATALREALQAQPGNLVQVAPIENVVRSAELKQQRRAVPWPKPTFVLHDPASDRCAVALSRFIGPPWSAAQAGDTEPVWIRGLPRRLQATPGVIELWLPPVDPANCTVCDR
ncbi:hypothetical protein RD110_15280 [Rhodoferax koreense]|uniref:PNPLA domain-containing protein n=1 Tax=Rhodoferax koreensis TaxID=1842727 RepID=A0A1P8JXA6_9BURK|nr:hypothetical protein [Rhodoferax koreense]APW38387.1 hypothetical protein RD110_15280 [Rhodoferax koreense]